jgi:hypothetical protein
MITKEYLSKIDEIYAIFGGAEQLEQTKCEAFELLLALQRFVMNPVEEKLKDLKSEIADRIITCEQMIRNSSGCIKEDFNSHCIHFKNALEGHSLHHLHQHVLSTYRDDIRLIIKQKINRTIERIESGYYDS